MSPTSYRASVVIERARRSTATAQLAALEGAGFSVTHCGGPSALPRTGCPLTAGQPCRMVDTADVVVHDLDLDDPDSRAAAGAAPHPPRRARRARDPQGHRPRARRGAGGLLRRLPLRHEPAGRGRGRRRRLARAGGRTDCAGRQAANDRIHLTRAVPRCPPSRVGQSTPTRGCGAGSHADRGQQNGANGPRSASRLPLVRDAEPGAGWSHARFRRWKRNGGDDGHRGSRMLRPFAVSGPGPAHGHDLWRRFPLLRPPRRRARASARRRDR